MFDKGLKTILTTDNLGEGAFDDLLIKWGSKHHRTKALKYSMLF